MTHHPKEYFFHFTVSSKTKTPLDLMIKEVSLPCIVKIPCITSPLSLRHDCQLRP